jgi:hypothetical protein
MVVIMGLCVMSVMIMLMNVSHRGMGMLRIFRVCMFMGMDMKMRMGVCGALMGMFMLMFVNVLVTVKESMFVMMVLGSWHPPVSQVKILSVH